MNAMTHETPAETHAMRKNFPDSAMPKTKSERQKRDEGNTAKKTKSPSNINAALCIRPVKTPSAMLMVVPTENPIAHRESETAISCMRSP